MGTLAALEVGGRASLPARVQSAAGALVLLLALLPASGHAQAGGDRVTLSGDSFVIRGATLFDGTGAPPRADASVVILDGQVIDVGGPEAVRVPEGAQVIDASGGWLLPGFVDVHASPSDPTFHSSLLAAGVATARLALAEAGDVQLARRPAPRLLLAGPLLEGGEPVAGQSGVETADQARRAVRRQLQGGSHFVRFGSGLPLDQLVAAAAEARRAGAKSQAEVEVQRWGDVARAGADAVIGLLPATAEWRAPDRTLPDSVHRWLERWERSGALESGDVDGMLAGLLGRNAFVAPLLAATEALLLCGDPDRREARDARAFDVRRARPTELSSPGAEPRTAERRPEPAADSREAEGCPPGMADSALLERARAMWSQTLELVRTLHAEGLLLTAGSGVSRDASPGAAFHRDLELFAEAGLPFSDILRIATRNGALALGVLHEAGTVEPGKPADLVLLAADPVVDIRNVRSVRWVFREGEFYVPEPVEEP